MIRKVAGWHIVRNEAPLALRPHFSVNLPLSNDLWYFFCYFVVKINPFPYP